ncbi:YrhA family protein [Enterococcus sp. AZ126]|uniref:YrhA family protein n=1 Tax=Enterococcus sp. AZ126 TaxID=2774635 RepID=UPI003F22F90A
MWKENLNRVKKVEESYDDKVNRGATDYEIANFIKKGREDLNIEFPAEYIEILKEINGLDFNGFVLYGVDEEQLENRENIEQRIYGAIEYNEIWYDVEENKAYIFLGESNISWYVYETKTKLYWELDNPSGSEMYSFKTFSELFDKMLSDSLL